MSGRSTCRASGAQLTKTQRSTATCQQVLREHYELPHDLSHQILTVLMTLNDEGESDLPLLAPRSARSW